jgi:nucleolin
MSEKRPAADEDAMTAKKRRRSERDKARAEKFHAKRKLAEAQAAATAAATPVASEAPEPAAAAEPADKPSGGSGSSTPDKSSSAASSSSASSSSDKRSERDKRRAEAFHAKKKAAEAAAAASTAEGAAAEPAAAPADAAGPEGSTKADKRSERDKRRAEAFHAKKQAAAAAAASGGADGDGVPAEPAAADEPDQKKKKPMSERDKRRAEAFAEKQKLKHAPKNSKGEVAKPQWEVHQWKRVFVANMGYDVTEDLSRQWFSNGTRQYGEIERITWLKDPATRSFKGCGFIHFSTAAAAKAAVEMNGSSLNGRKVKVAWQKDTPKDQRQDKGAAGESGGLEEKPAGCVTVHLGNLDYATTEADIRKWATENCGTVAIVKLLRNRKTQKSTGCGFVAFTNSQNDGGEGGVGTSAEDAVDKAIALGKAAKALINGRELRVKYARKAPRPTYTNAEATDHPGQAARLGKGITPSTASTAAAAAAAGARLSAAAASTRGGGGGLAVKLMQRKLEAAKWNGEDDATATTTAAAAAAAAAWQPISVDVKAQSSATSSSTSSSTAASAQDADGDDAALSKAEKRSARDKRRAEAFHARKLKLAEQAQEQQ